MNNHTSTPDAHLDRQIKEAKNGLLSSGLGCVGLLALGGIITGITYAMAGPGGTYVATTGLFLVGVVSGVVAVWRFAQLLFYLAKKASRPATVSHAPTSNTARTWKDLD